MGGNEQVNAKANNKFFLFKKPYIFILFLISISFLSLEFLFDLTNEEYWYNFAIYLDSLIIISYFIVFIVRILAIINYRNFSFTTLEKAEVAYAIIVAAFLYTPRISAGLIVARIVINLFVKLLETRLGTKIISNINLRPSQTLALSFVGLIAVGTFLLMLPAATTNGKGAYFIDALFTMTSASCVAGLSILNIGQDFTVFGQAIILLGIQVGGLGIMVLSAAFAVLIGGNIPLKKQAGLVEVLDLSTPKGLIRLIRVVAASTFIVEFLGAVTLFFLWVDEFPDFAERLWMSLFHSISSFCNCGLSLLPDSLFRFVNEPSVLWVFMLLITIGGLGFFVILDIFNPEVWRIKKAKAIWSRFQIQTRVVLIATIVLNTFGLLVFLFFEYDGALRGLPTLTKINSALFQTVNLRSAGLSVVPLDNLLGPTIIFCIVYMFIGAAPGSTGGGVKTTTAAISIMAVRTMLRGRSDVEIMGRKISSTIVNRSLSIVLIAAMAIVILLSFLLATQNIKFEMLFFESVSAFGTVGLSMGATTMLDDVGKGLIIFLMYIGRIGPLTLALAVGEKKHSQEYHLPKGNISVG